MMDEMWVAVLKSLSNTDNIMRYIFCSATTMAFISLVQTENARCSVYSSGVMVQGMRVNNKCRRKETRRDIKSRQTHPIGANIWHGVFVYRMRFNGRRSAAPLVGTYVYYTHTILLYIMCTG